MSTPVTIGDVSGSSPSPSSSSSASGRAMLNSTMQSARIYLLSFPAGTRIVCVICLALQIAAQALGPSVGTAWCMEPGKVFAGQLYRLVTHAVVHGGWPHLVLNLVSLLPLGPRVEEKLGTLPFLMLQLHAAFLGGAAYLVLIAVAGLPRYNDVCVLGYSGVLLTLLVIFVYKFATHESIKVFGVVSVPNTLAPWACLVLFQLLPRVSFFGHLAGILVGYAMCAGGMRALMPRSATLQSLEKRWPCAVLTRMPGYVKAPADSALPVTISNGVAAVGGAGGGGARPPSAGGGRFPGVGRQLVPTAERGAALYEGGVAPDSDSAA